MFDQEAFTVELYIHDLLAINVTKTCVTSSFASQPHGQSSGNQLVSLVFQLSRLSREREATFLLSVPIRNLAQLTPLPLSLYPILVINPTAFLHLSPVICCSSLQEIFKDAVEYSRHSVPNIRSRGTPTRCVWNPNQHPRTYHTIPGTYVSLSAFCTLVNLAWNSMTASLHAVSSHNLVSPLHYLTWIPQCSLVLANCPCFHVHENSEPPRATLVFHSSSSQDTQPFPISLIRVCGRKHSRSSPASYIQRTCASD